MQKLGALDANFLYTETDLTPNHIASVQRLALPEDVTPGEFVASFREYMQARLHLVPYLHRRLQFVPGNFDHPCWVEAKNIDIDYHIHEVIVDAPGTIADLERKIAELHTVHMDRSRPLWKTLIVTGLEDGTVALYNQIHHAAIDGMAGQAATMILMDNTPEHPPVEPPAGVVQDDSMATLLQMSFENLIKYQLGATTRFLDGMETMRRMIQRSLDPSRPFGSAFEAAPRTRFNRKVGIERTFAVSELPLAEVKAIGTQLGCTLNDVFMAICAGGMRRYLERAEELPEQGLIAGCPVSLRRPGTSDAGGNQVTMMNVNLNTHVSDPKLRLLAIRESSRVAKELTADFAAGTDMNVSLPGLPAIMTMAATAAETTGVAEQVNPPMNVVISNVPGPREVLYSNGARMLTHYPVSIPQHGAGLNITVQSYLDKLYVGITACAKALPDAHLLRDDMIAAFQELREATARDNISEISTRAARGELNPAPKTVVEESLNKVA